MQRMTKETILEAEETPVLEGTNAELELSEETELENINSEFEGMGQVL